MYHISLKRIDNIYIFILKQVIIVDATPWGRDGTSTIGGWFGRLFDSRHPTNKLTKPAPVEPLKSAHHHNHATVNGHVPPAHVHAVSAPVKQAATPTHQHAHHHAHIQRASTNEDEFLPNYNDPSYASDNKIALHPIDQRFDLPEKAHREDDTAPVSDIVAPQSDTRADVSSDTSSPPTYEASNIVSNRPTESPAATADGGAPSSAASTPLGNDGILSDSTSPPPYEMTQTTPHATNESSNQPEVSSMDNPPLYSTLQNTIDNTSNVDPHNIADVARPVPKYDSFLDGLENSGGKDDFVPTYEEAVNIVTVEANFLPHDNKLYV